MAIFTAFAWIFTLLFSCINAARLPPIYWNSSNEMFIGDEDHLLTVKLMDTVDIHCPFYNDTVTRDEAEYSLIYSVSEKGYQDCNLDNAQPVGQCTSPFGEESIVKLAFRDYTPLPGAIEYQPGQTYYFISTSDGTESGLQNKKNGLCRRSHMRLKVKVESRDDDEAETGTAESASSMDRHKTATQDDLDRRPAISKNGNALYATGRASSAIRKQYTTGQVPSDTAISDDEETESKEAEDEGSVGVKFIVNDNKLIRSTPSADSVSVDVDKHTQADGRTNSLTYDPYGLEIGSNSVKRDHHTSDAKNAKVKGKSQQQENFVLYEIHEMVPQRINRYEVNSSASSTSWCSTLFIVAISLAIIRRWVLL